MKTTLAKALGYAWRLPLYFAAVLGAIAFVVADDWIQVVTFFLIAPTLLFACLLLLRGAALQRRYRGTYLWLAGAILLFFVTSVALVAYQRNDPRCLRSTARWLLHSRQYKAEVLAQLEPKSGELKHVEWDGWGSAPTGETTMYLVYDPSNALWNAAKQGKDGVVPGIPCPVERVHRLETYWYTILYPTNFDWLDCRSGGTELSRSNIAVVRHQLFSSSLISAAAFLASSTAPMGKLMAPTLGWPPPP